MIGRQIGSRFSAAFGFIRKYSALDEPAYHENHQRLSFIANAPHSFDRERIIKDPLSLSFQKTGIDPASYCEITIAAVRVRARVAVGNIFVRGL